MWTGSAVDNEIDDGDMSVVGGSDSGQQSGQWTPPESTGQDNGQWTPPGTEVSIIFRATEKCVLSSKGQSRFASVVIDIVIIWPCLHYTVQHTRWCPCISVDLATMYSLRLRAFEGCLVSSKKVEGSDTETRKLYKFTYPSPPMFDFCDPLGFNRGSARLL